jgi:deazaflavin-dependent oxidoreductase (nitroreductase family)
VYRLTNGRHTFATDDGVAVIASNFGQRRHAAWYHNLRVNPEGEVAVDGITRRFRAAEAEGDRRARIWQEGLHVDPGWSQH